MIKIDILKIKKKTKYQRVCCPIKSQQNILWLIGKKNSKKSLQRSNSKNIMLIEKYFWLHFQTNT